MFHIKPDARAQASAEILYQSLLEELHDKPLNNISISRLASVAKVSRTTFYRNFDEVIDILHWKLDVGFTQALSTYSPSRATARVDSSLLLHILDYWFEHSEALEAVIKAGRLDLIYSCFHQKAPLLDDYAQAAGLSLTGPGAAYSLSVRAGFFTGIILTWLQQGKKHTAAQIASYLHKEHHKMALTGLLI